MHSVTGAETTIVPIFTVVEHHIKVHEWRTRQPSHAGSAHLQPAGPPSRNFAGWSQAPGCINYKQLGIFLQTRPVRWKFRVPDDIRVTQTRAVWGGRLDLAGNHDSQGKRKVEGKRMTELRLLSTHCDDGGFVMHLPGRSNRM